MVDNQSRSVWKLNIWVGIQLIKYEALTMAYPEIYFGTWVANNRECATSNKCLFLCSTIPFC